MKRHLLFLFLTTLLMATLWAQPQKITSQLVILEEEDEDFDDGSHDREIKLDIDVDEIRYEAKLNNGTNSDEIRIEIKLDSNFPDDNDSGEIEIRFKYSQGINSTEIQFSYRLEMTDIIEYRENGTEPGYQEGEEVSIYNIGGTGWEDMTRPGGYEVLNITGTDVHVLNASTLDGVVTIIIRASGGVVDLGNATLTPNSVKMDILINNFNYTETGTQLALKSKVKTGATMETQNNTTDELLGIGNNETEISINMNGTQGYFSWSDTAEVDGNTVAVIDSALLDDDEGIDVIAGEDSKKLYFSFNATDANSILWDPKVGVVSNDIQVPEVDTTTPPPTTQVSTTPVTSDPVTTAPATTDPLTTSSETADVTSSDETITTGDGETSSMTTSEPVASDLTSDEPSNSEDDESSAPGITSLFTAFILFGTVIITRSRKNK